MKENWDEKWFQSKEEKKKCRYKEYFNEVEGLKRE